MRRFTSRATTGLFASVLGAVLLPLFLMVPMPAFADDPDEGGSPHAHDETDIWAMARGGQIYDNWAKVLEVDLPEATHPSYPKAGKQKGGGTWRCKECHGWDYRGADGAYSGGSHFTGIKGLRDLVGTDPDAIHKTIMDKTHQYTEQMIPHSAMEKLSQFVSLGQLDMDLYVDRATKKARGFAQRGAAMFQTICAVCHGFDGKEINFKDDKNPEYVGTVAQKNPWEFIHKARFGQPGVVMVGLVALPTLDIVDLLAYAQTLPAK